MGHFRSQPVNGLLFGHLSDVMLRVLLIIQRLLQENKHSSKRDIYYMHPSVFLGEYGCLRPDECQCIKMTEIPFVSPCL